MADLAKPVIINPSLTLAGQAAAFNAAGDGFELELTHISFGLAHYNPDGHETALKEPVGSKVPLAGASRPTPYQIHSSVAWRENVGELAIGEIAYWAGNTLAFVWSKADGSIAGYKTDGVTYVLFSDLALAQVPVNSISFVVDPIESAALAALTSHEGDVNPHSQYALRSNFPDYQGYLWGDTSGSANQIVLTLPPIVNFTEYGQGGRFTFKAIFDNTGATSINVNGVGLVQVLKTGGVPLTAGSIIAGGVYDVLHDGGSFQLTAGAGFASAEATTVEVTTGTSPDSTSWVSVRRLLQALALKANLNNPILTGQPKAPTAQPGTNSEQLGTTAFIQAAVSTAISALVNSAPASLDTLKELATAVGNDPAFATTINNALNLKAPLASPTFTGNPKAPTPAVGDNSLSLSTTAFVQRAIATLVDSSPAALDTLQELATALGNDPNFATTITNILSLKAPLASPALTGNPTAPTQPVGTNSTRIASTAFVFAVQTLLEAAIGTKQPNLGYTPVRQGGGAGQLENDVDIGWDGGALRAQVDLSDLGAIWTDSIASARAVIAQASSVVGEVGTYALLLVSDGTGSGANNQSPGTLFNGGLCRYSSASGHPGPFASGTWRLQGAVYNSDAINPDSASICLRIA